jgi:hypothetical protein
MSKESVRYANLDIICLIINVFNANKKTVLFVIKLDYVSSVILVTIWIMTQNNVKSVLMIVIIAQVKIIVFLVQLLNIYKKFNIKKKDTLNLLIVKIIQSV